MSAAALAVAGNAMANTATTSVAAPSKSITDNLLVRYYGEFTGNALSELGSSNAPNMVGGDGGKINLFNSVSLGYKSGDFRAVVNPRFIYGISNGDAFSWDDLRVTFTRANVAKLGAYSLKSVSLVNILSTTGGTRQAGQIYRPRLQLGHSIDLGSGSRWSLDVTTYADGRFYDDTTVKKADRSLVGFYSALALGYQINPTLGAAFTFEAAAAAKKVPGTTGAIDFVSTDIYGKSATGLRIGMPVSLASGKIELVPFLQTSPTQGFMASRAYLGMELSGTLY
jgi:hypothetical protein